MRWPSARTSTWFSGPSPRDSTRALLRSTASTKIDYCRGTVLAEAAAALAEWVEGQTRPGTEPCFVGHNAPFDWSYVAHLYAELERPNPFGYKALDTKAFSAGVLKLHWLDTGKEILFERLGLPPEDKGQKHRADYDARVQAELLRALLEVNES